MLTMLELLRGCHPGCSPCNSGDDPGDEALCRQHVCNWAEEEVDGPDGPVSRDYGFLGSRDTQKACPAVSWPWSGAPTDAPASLYERGALIPQRGLLNASCPSSSSSKLQDHYSLDPQPFGRGSYGEVYGATHLRTSARRAVKVVAKEGLKRYVKDASGFVRREVEILRSLDHPNVVRLYEAFEDEVVIYLVLELCQGGDLLERVTVAQQRMSERGASTLLQQMLSAICHLSSRGVVHRDLKPENFLFTQREPEIKPAPPTRSPVKLIDFGLSKRLSVEGCMGKVTPKIGTTEYMAPEAFAGRVQPDMLDRTDIWSLGVVLHVTFIGHFPSPKLADMTTEEYMGLSCWRHISANGRDLLGKMLKTNPLHRPSAAIALTHPWFAETFTLSQEALRICRSMPIAFSAFSTTAELRRVALAAMAREVDDTGLVVVREIYYHLELACGGALSRRSLHRALDNTQGLITEVLSELLRFLDVLDLDGSGQVDWTELLAPLIGADLSYQAARGSSTSAPSSMVSDSLCWRAFDLLSGGGGGGGAQQITAQSLGAILLEGAGADGSSAAGAMEQGASNSPVAQSWQSTGTESSFGATSRGGETRSASPLGEAALTAMVRSVSGSDSIDRARFLSLVKTG